MRCLAVPLLVLLFAGPLWADEGNTADGASSAAARLDAEALTLLETQLATLDAVLLVQEKRLEKFEDQMLLTTDPAELARLDGLATRLTEVLDELEYQRDALTEQVKTIRELIKE